MLNIYLTRKDIEVLRQEPLISYACQNHQKLSQKSFQRYKSTWILVVYFKREPFYPSCGSFGFMKSKNCNKDVFDLNLRQVLGNHPT